MRSLTVRLTAWFAVLASAVIVLVLVAGGWLLNRQMIRGLELLHEVEAVEMAELLESEVVLSDEEIFQRIYHDSETDAELFFIQIHDSVGRVRFRSSNLGDAMLPDLSGAVPHWTLALPDIGMVRASEFYMQDWHIQIASRMAPTQRVLDDYIRIAALLALGGVVTSIGLGWGFSRISLKPLRAIERTARQIGGDNLSERIPVPEGRDELAALSRLLNETFDRIEGAFDQVRRFTADASHELKTPLALMRLNAEKLRERLGTDEVAQESLDEVLEEIERMNQIIEHLLFLSKVDSGVLQIEKTRLVLPEWLESFFEDAHALADDQGGRFEGKIGGAGTLAAVPSLWRQLLLNLLTNALKFNAAGGLVSLQVVKQGGSWRWTMEDDGPGLPENELGRVFDRFVRLGAVGDEPVQPGHGLGLAICESIVALHEGEIWAENRRGRSGLRVVVVVPATGK
jgi:signal transduction histidine kinase